jgi:hypothetical protein
MWQDAAASCAKIAEERASEIARLNIRYAASQVKRARTLHQFKQLRAEQRDLLNAAPPAGPDKSSADVARLTQENQALTAQLVDQRGLVAARDDGLNQLRGLLAQAGYHSPVLNAVRDVIKDKERWERQAEISAASYGALSKRVPQCDQDKTVEVKV